jgi:hypothetical protein
MGKNEDAQKATKKIIVDLEESVTNNFINTLNYN